MSSNINFTEMRTNCYSVTYYFQLSLPAACIIHKLYMENLSFYGRVFKSVACVILEHEAKKEIKNYVF